MHEFGNGESDPNAAAAYSGPMNAGVVGYDSLFQILWRGWWLILLCIILALGGAIAYLRTATPQYESIARVLVDKPGQQARTDVPQPTGSTQINYLATQASMITSPEIVAAAMRDPNLLTLPTFSDPNYVQELIGTLTAEVAKKADIIQVTASSPHPEDAARIVNAVVRAYKRWHETDKQLSTADLLGILNSQLEKRYQELRAKRQQRMMFEQRYPKIVESGAEGLGSKTLDLLKENLAAAYINRIEQESYYDGLASFADQPEKLREYVYSRRNTSRQTADEQERIRLQNELLSSQLQLERLAKIGGAAKERNLLESWQKQVREQLAQLDSDFVQNQIAAAKAFAENARKQEQQVKEAYDKEFGEVQTLSLQYAEYVFIVAECETIEGLCDSLLKQINALDVNATFSGLKIHVLEQAMPALEPSSPQPLRILPLALMLGLMAGAGLALLRDWRDQRVRSADEITAMLGVPVLGAVPSIPKRRLATRRLLLSAPNSDESEAYRVIRTALFFSVPRDEARTVLVTSPASLEGKTTLVTNLGIAMAQAGQRTLILDADLRRPMQHKTFAMNGQETGLFEVLIGKATLEQALRREVIPGLDILASKYAVESPSELLSNAAFAALLESLKQTYDRVLVDAPPLGVASDAQVLAALCDVTVLVLRADHSKRRVTQYARDLLLTVGARVAGVVVNDVSEKDYRYLSYGAYSPYPDHYGSNGQAARRKLSVADPPGNGETPAPGATP